MNLKIENRRVDYQNTKVTLSWDKSDADLYIVYLKKDGFFTEIARTYEDAFTTVSLLPVGDNEFCVRAFKDGKIVVESPVEVFNNTKIDVVSIYENNKQNIRFFYSKYPDAEGYRLSRKDESGIFGFKNSNLQSILIKLEEKKDSYRIAPFIIENNKRKNLCWSDFFYNPVNGFGNVTLYKSYPDNTFLSWNYEGLADGYYVYSEFSNQPIYEISNGITNFVTLKGYKSDVKFQVKAFINTPDGKIILDSTDYISLQERKYYHPEVSLIIPAYNAQDYIARSIDSALASNFDDLEIIIVDDGSTDKTYEILEWYAQNYPNVRIAKKENSGAHDARNYGIKMAQGKYIQFMDSDDVIRPNMINRLYDEIKKNKCEIAVGNYYLRADVYYLQGADVKFKENCPLDIDEYLDKMPSSTVGFVIWYKLYDASVIKERYMPRIWHEDAAWTPYILSYMHTFCYVPFPGYIWWREIRKVTLGMLSYRKPQHEIFEDLKLVVMFYIKNGNSQKINQLKAIARKYLQRKSLDVKDEKIKNKYFELIEKITNNF